MRFHQPGKEPIVSTIIIAVDSTEPDRLFAGTVQAMRRSLDVTEEQLARAAGMACQCIEAIEAGGTTTRAERHDLTVALAWLSNRRVAKGPGS